jgi:two-component system chemotaxis sensor kinase CheA
MSTSPGHTFEYEQFRETFFAECSEMLIDMDARLAGMNASGVDSEELNAVFRAVHSIKAGAGMFNYADLVAFAHSFEALLDRMRDGRMTMNTAITGLIVRAGDILSELVSAAQDDRPAPLALGADVTQAIKLLLGQDQETCPAMADLGHASALGTDTRRVRIGFTPKADLVRHANEPLLLIRELRTLGALEIVCDTTRVPVLDALDVEDVYLAWTFTIITGQSDAAIREVFEFVEDDAEITLTDLTVCGDASEGDGDADDFGFWMDPPSGTNMAPKASDVVLAPSVFSAPPPVTSSGAVAKANVPSSIRVDLSRVDRLVNMVGELVISQAMLRQELADLNHSGAVEGLDALESLTRELQDCVMAVRMQSVRSVFSRMPRLVREVAGKLGKAVRLDLHGEQTELDKTVIEELSDPLTHMIRNSIDHGIEMPDVRLACGKIAEGVIRLSAAHVGSNILIQIEDDGAGLNRDRLYRKAVEKNVIADGAKLSDAEITDLIFAAGFSTAAVVSDVSGRGVGMDVVRRNIQNIGGRIQVSSVEGKGTCFTLVIPLTLAVLEGMLVKVGTERYILPLTSIVESFRPVSTQLRTLSDGVRVANIRGEYVRILGLNRLFGAAEAIDDPTKGLIVLVETASGGKVGLVVDELIGQQQVVIKSLKANYSPVPGLSGATILGDGRVALIIDVEQLGDLQEQNA